MTTNTLLNTTRTSFAIAFDNELNFSDPNFRDCMLRVLPSIFVAVDASDGSFVCCNLIVGYHPEIDSFVCDIDHTSDIAVRLKMEFDENLLQDDELSACAEWITGLMDEDANLVATLPVDSVLFMLEMSSGAGMVINWDNVVGYIPCEFDTDEILVFAEADPSDLVFEYDDWLTITVADVLQASKTNDGERTIWSIGEHEISFFEKDWR